MRTKERTKERGKVRRTGRKKKGLFLFRSSCGLQETCYLAKPAIWLGMHYIISTVRRGVLLVPPLYESCSFWES